MDPSLYAIVNRVSCLHCCSDVSAGRRLAAVRFLSWCYETTLMLFNWAGIFMPLVQTPQLINLILFIIKFWFQRHRRLYSVVDIKWKWGIPRNFKYTLPTSFQSKHMAQFAICLLFKRIVIRFRFFVPCSLWGIKGLNSEFPLKKQSIQINSRQDHRRPWNKEPNPALRTHF